MSGPGSDGEDSPASKIGGRSRMTMDDLDAAPVSTASMPAVGLKETDAGAGTAHYATMPAHSSAGSLVEERESTSSSSKRSLKSAGRMVGIVSTATHTSKPVPRQRSKDGGAYLDYALPDSKRKMTVQEAIDYFGGNEETGRIYMGLLDRRVELDEADVVSFFGGNSGMAERFMTVAQEIRDEVGKDTGVTLRDVKRLEGAWIDFSTDTGGNLGEVGGGGEGGTGGLAREQRVARLASANRPPSYTHAIMKRAGLEYSRGQPTFPIEKGSRRSGMSIDYLRRNEHDPLVKQKYLKKPWWDSFEQETKLAGRHRSKSTEPERLNLSLPRLCGAKSSLSRRLEDSDAFLGVSTVSGPRGSGTITFDTSVEPHAKVVRFVEEAREIKKEVEGVLAKQFLVDVRGWDIPVRILRPVSMQHAAISNKHALQANVGASVRAITVKRETKIPQLMARHLHSRQFYASGGLEPQSLPASVARLKKSVHREVDEILIVEGMTRQVASAELAKEVGRSFLFLKDYPALDVTTEAGFCEFCAYLWVKSERDKALEGERNAIEELEMCQKEMDEANAFMEVVQGELQDAKRERDEADEAELKAKKQLVEAQEAKMYGWPGAARKMEVAQQSQLEAKKELEEALEAEARVCGVRLVEAEEMLKTAGDELVRATAMVEFRRATAAQCNLYLLAQENNPHPVYGKGLRKAIKGYDAAEGKMGYFLMHLKEKGKFVKLKGKSKEELEAEAEERYRAEKERVEAEEAERISERLECLARVVTRLSEAPPGAPGPPAVLSYEEAPLHVHAEPAESYEEELMDDLQDRMALVDAGSMNSEELAEYCALFLRGEHDGQYCSMAGEEAFKQAKEVRALGELDLAMKHLKKARSAFTNAGQLGEKRMWDVQSLEKAVSNEVHQLGVAVSLHKKAKAAVETGALVQFRKHYTDAKTLYEKCGEAARKEGMLPALEQLEVSVIVQESNVLRLTDLLKQCQEAVDEKNYDMAGRLIAVANGTKDDCGNAGVQLYQKVQELQDSIMKDLREQSEKAEADARALIDQDDLDGAFVCIKESWRAIKHAVVASGIVKHDAPSDALDSAAKKMALSTGSAVISLEKEMMGTSEQFKALQALNVRTKIYKWMRKSKNDESLRVLQITELDTWPELKDVVTHLAMCRDSMVHLNEARKLLGEARSDHAGAKIIGLQQVELQIALRIHANDRVRLILTSIKELDTPDVKLPYCCQAAAANNAAGLELLHKAGANVNAADAQGNTPLHYAVNHVAVDVIKKLGEFKDVDPNSHNADGHTPLVIAVSGDSAMTGGQMKRTVLKMRRKSVGLLINNAAVINRKVPAATALMGAFKKVDPNTPANDRHSRTPLIIAVESGNELCVKMLLAHPKIDANLVDERGRTALTAAIWLKTDCTRLLVSQKIDMNKASPGKRWSAIHISILSNNLEALGQLLEHPRVDITQQDSMGWTALHLAMRDKNVKALTMLLACPRIRDDSFMICQNMRTASSMRLRGDKVGSGFWLDATPEIYQELPGMLFASQQWDTLHEVLTNIAFMSGIILCHGVDIAITMLHSVTQACAAFPGVGASIREDFDQYLAVIVGRSDDLRTKKISFAELAVSYHLTGVREIKNSFQQVVDEVNEIGNRPVGWGSAYTLKASAYLQRARILSHGGSLKLDALLQHPVEFETACKALSRFFGQDKLDDGALQELTQMIGVTGMGKQSDIRDLEQACALLRVAQESRSMSEHIRITFEGLDQTLSGVRDALPAMLGAMTNEIVESGSSEPFYRVVRLVKDERNGHCSAVVRASSDPFCLYGLIELSHLRNVVDKLIHASNSRDQGNTFAPGMKITKMSRATPSVFLTMEIALPIRVIQLFPTQEDLSSQLVADIIGCISIKPISVNVLSFKLNASTVLVELLSDVEDSTGADGQRAFRRNRGQAEKLAEQVRVSGSNLSKGVITEHILSVTITEGHLPPTMPGEWRDAHCYVSASASGMHTELEVLEKFFLPAISTNLLPSRTYFTWTILLKQDEDNIIGVPRRLAMVDRGHLPQGRMTVGQTEQGGQPLCFPLVLVGGVEGRKPSPWELNYIRQKWVGQINADVPDENMADVESAVAAHACVVGGKEAFALVRNALTLGDSVAPEAASVMMSSSEACAKMLLATGGAGGSRRVCTYEAKFEGYEHQVNYVVKKLKTLKAGCEKVIEILHKLRQVEKKSASSVQHRIKLAELRLKKHSDECLLWWRLARAEIEVPNAVLCDPFFCKMALEAGEPGIAVVEAPAFVTTLQALPEDQNGHPQGDADASHAPQGAEGGAGAPTEGDAAGEKQVVPADGDAAKVVPGEGDAAGEKQVVPADVDAAKVEPGEGEAAAAPPTAVDDTSKRTEGVEGGADSPRSSVASSSMTNTPMSTPMSALSAEKSRVTYQVTRGKLSGGGDYSRAASTGVKLDVRWGMYRAAFAIYESISCYTPSSNTAAAPYHQHLMDRVEQEYLRDVHAGNMVVEQGEPRALLIQDIVTTLLARFQPDKPAALDSLDRSVSQEFDDASTSVESAKFDSIGTMSTSFVSSSVAAVPRKPPIYMVHGNRGSGRTTILSKVAQELQQKLIDKEFDGAVISHFQAGGTFGEVVAYLKTEVALQTRGSSAFEQFPSEDGEAVAQSSAAQLAVSSQKRHLASLSSTAKVTVSSSKSIEFDHAKRMLTELKQELHVAIREGHHIIFVLDNLDDKSAMEMMQFVLAIQNWAYTQSNQTPSHDEDDEDTSVLKNTHMGSVTLLMPCETIVSLRKYARIGEFPSDPEQEHTIIHKFDIKALSVKEQKTLFQKVLQSRGIISVDRETCGNALEKKQEQADNPLYLVTLGVAASAILERKLAEPTQKALMDIVDKAPKTLSKLFSSYLLPHVADYAGTSFEVAEQAFHVLSVHTNGLRTESILDSTRSLISSNLPVTETRLMMLLSITAPLLRPRKNFSDPVAAAHPYMSLMTSEERIEGLGTTRGSSAVDFATAQGAADRFISEEERVEDEIEAGVLEDMEQLRDHVHDLFVRSFVNPMIEAAGQQYDKLLHPELDPIDDKVTFPRGVEFGGPDLANPSAWKGDAFLVLQRWCRMMELLAAPFPGYKESNEPVGDENIFERVSSAALPPHLKNIGAVDLENSETSYSQCFTRLCLLENACVLVSSKAFTDPVITALEATIAEEAAEEESSNVCSKNVHRMRLLLERFTQNSRSMLSFRDKVRKQVLDLRATLVDDAATFWRNGVPQERLDREFRARISSSLGDLRSDIQRRVRAASNIKHEGAIITNTGGKDRGMTQTVELSWEQEDERWAAVGEKIIRDQCQSLESKLGELRPVLLRVAVGVAHKVFEENASMLERLLDVEENYRAALECFDTCNRCGHVKYQENDRSSNSSAGPALRKISSLERRIKMAESSLSTMGSNSFAYGPACYSGGKSGLPTFFKIRARNAQNTNRHSGGEAALFKVTITADVPLSTYMSHHHSTEGSARGKHKMSSRDGGSLNIIRRESTFEDSARLVMRASAEENPRLIANSKGGESPLTAVAHVRGIPTRERIKSLHKMSPNSPRMMMMISDGHVGQSEPKMPKAKARRNSVAMLAHYAALDSKVSAVDPLAGLTKRRNSKVQSGGDAEEQFGSRPSSNDSVKEFEIMSAPVRETKSDYQETIQHSIVDNGDGTYDVRFTPSFTGVYDISISYIDEHDAAAAPVQLMGTPFSVEFRENRPWQPLLTHKVSSFSQDLPLLVGALGGVAIAISPGLSAPYAITRIEHETHVPSWNIQECGISSDLVEGAEYDQGRIFSAVFEGSERAFCLGARPGDSKDPVTSGVSTFEVYTLGVQVNEEEPVDAPPVISIQGGKMWAACIPPDRVMKKGIRVSEKLWPWDGVLAFNHKDETMIALEEEDRKRGLEAGDKDEAVGEEGAGDGVAGKEGVFKGGRSIECKKVVDYSLPIVRIVGIQEASGEDGDDPQRGLSKLQHKSGAEAGNTQREDMLVVNYSQLRGEWICKAGYVPVASSGGGGGLVFGGLDHRDLVLTSVEGSGDGEVIQSFEKGMFSSVLPHHAAPPISPLAGSRDGKNKLGDMLGSIDGSVTAEDTSNLSRVVSTSSDSATIVHGGFLWSAHAVSGDIPPARSGASVVCDKGIVSLCGGRTPTGEVLDDLYTLDLATHQWKCVFSFHSIDTAPWRTAINGEVMVGIQHGALETSSSDNLEARWLDLPRVNQASFETKRCKAQVEDMLMQVSKFQSEVEIELKDSNMGVVRNAIYKAIVQKDVQSKMDTISELIFYTKQQGLIMDDLAASFEILKDTAKRLAATASAIKLSKIKEIQSHESSVTRNIMARLKVLQNSGWYRNSSSSYEMAYVAIQIDASSIKDMLTQCEDVAVMDHFFDHNSTAEVSRALEAEEACLLLYRKLWAIRHTFAGWSNATLECPSLCSPEPLDGMISKANAIVRQQHSLASSEVAKHTLEALDRARRARDCLSLLQPKRLSQVRGIVLQMELLSGVFLSPPTMFELVMHGRKGHPSFSALVNQQREGGVILPIPDLVKDLERITNPHELSESIPRLPDPGSHLKSSYSANVYFVPDKWDLRFSNIRLQDRSRKFSIKANDPEKCLSAGAGRELKVHFTYVQGSNVRIDANAYVWSGQFSNFAVYPCHRLRFFDVTGSQSMLKGPEGETVQAGEAIFRVGLDDGPFHFSGGGDWTETTLFKGDTSHEDSPVTPARRRPVAFYTRSELRAECAALRRDAEDHAEVAGRTEDAIAIAPGSNHSAISMGRSASSLVDNSWPFNTSQPREASTGRCVVVSGLSRGAEVTSIWTPWVHDSMNRFVVPRHGMNYGPVSFGSEQNDGAGEA